MEEPQRVLVVEDEVDIQDVLRYNLTRSGFIVQTASDGPTGLSLARESTVDLVVLDLMLPGMDGIEVCRRLRKDSDVPVIMLTARVEEVDKIVGLEIGADDYLVKPFSVRELIARIRSVLRRYTPNVDGDGVGTLNTNLKSGNLVVDTSAHMAWVQDTEIALTSLEFKLLTFLMINQGKVLTRDQLMDHAWGIDYTDYSRTLDVHIRWLRSKIDSGTGQPSRITTVRGVGYRFDK
jgi:DNA-binding response OmpR family regulator